MINELIAKRWSTRAFSEQPIEKGALEELLTAASKSPSAFNEQPWRFIVGQKGQGVLYEQLLACLVDTNRLWAQKAPLLVLLLAKKTLTYNGKPNAHAAYDTGQAAAYFTLQATEQGLYVHQMGGYDSQKVKETFQLDDDLQPMVIIAVGYKGNDEHLPEAVKQKEQSRTPRKGLEELVVSSQ